MDTSWSACCWSCLCPITSNGYSMSKAFFFSPFCLPRKQETCAKRERERARERERERETEMGWKVSCSYLCWDSVTYCRKLVIYLQNRDQRIRANNLQLPLTALNRGRSACSTAICEECCAWTIARGSTLSDRGLSGNFTLPIGFFEILENCQTSHITVREYGGVFFFSLSSPFFSRGLTATFWCDK